MFLFLKHLKSGRFIVDTHNCDFFYIPWHLRDTAYVNFMDLSYFGIHSFKHYTDAFFAHGLRNYASQSARMVQITIQILPIRLYSF